MSDYLSDYEKSKLIWEREQRLDDELKDYEWKNHYKPSKMFEDRAKEIVACLELLTTAFPNTYIKSRAKMGEVWEDLYEGVPLNFLYAGIKEYLRHNDKWPTVQQIASNGHMRSTGFRDIEKQRANAIERAKDEELNGPESSQMFYIKNLRELCEAFDRAHVFRCANCGKELAEHEQEERERKLSEIRVQAYEREQKSLIERISGLTPGGNEDPPPKMSCSCREKDADD